LAYGFVLFRERERANVGFYASASVVLRFEEFFSEAEYIGLYCPCHDEYEQTSCPNQYRLLADVFLPGV
jgi:hypothetical protein